MHAQIKSRFAGMNLLRYSKACRNKPDLPAVPETEKTHGTVRNVMRNARETRGIPVLSFCHEK